MQQGGDYGGDIWAGLRQQVVRRTLRMEQKGEDKGEGERGEQRRSSDGVEGWNTSHTGAEVVGAGNIKAIPHDSTSSAYAAAAAAADAAAAAAAAADAANDAAAAATDSASAGVADAGNGDGDTPEAAAVASSTGGSDHALHRVLAAGSAVEAASPSLPLPSPSLGQQSQQANNLPPECRDDRATAAVTVETVRHEYQFPDSASLLSLYPYEVTVSNKCRQRAVAAMSVSMMGVQLRSYMLLPRLRPLQSNSLQSMSVFKVLPPLGAPDDAMIIPPGGSFKFNCTVMLDLAFALFLYNASFSPL
ncbi:unnamed protein product [Closterium sp. Yama58-4]|nr:unnamed protein product [Closterium sp. Yama58-4]